MSKNGMVWLEGAGVWAKLAPRKHPNDESPPPSKRHTLDEPRKLASSPTDADADADASAPPSCSICLDDLKREDKAVLTPCMHEFHHACIAKWLFSFSSRLACPLCKAPPAALLHSIRSDGSYVEKELVPPVYNNGSTAADPARADVMARLAAILEQSMAQRGSGYTRRHHAGRRGGRDLGGHRGGPSPYSERVQRHARAAAAGATAGPSFGFRGDDLAMDSAFLDAYEFSEDGVESAEAAALRWRRRVYAEGVWAVPLGAAPAPPRPLVAPASGSARQRRVGDWVHRELQALLGADEDVSLVKAFVLGLVTTYGAVPPDPPARLSHPGVSLALASAGGGRAEDPVAHLVPFLGARRAPLFWHELCCFVTAPAYTIETYDQIVRYERPGWEERNEERREERRPGRVRGGGRGDGYRDEEREERRVRRRRERSRSRERERRRSRSPRQRRRAEERRSPVERDGGEGRWRMWTWGDPIE